MTNQKPFRVEENTILDQGHYRVWKYNKDVEIREGGLKVRFNRDNNEDGIINSSRIWN